jgi:hypothetical protein
MISRSGGRNQQKGRMRDRRKTPRIGTLKRWEMKPMKSFALFLRESKIFLFLNQSKMIIDHVTV